MLFPCVYKSPYYEYSKAIYIYILYKARVIDMSIHTAIFVDMIQSQTITPLYDTGVNTKSHTL